MSTAAVRTHYDAFPYPTVVNLALPQPSSHRRRRLDYLLRRRRHTAIPEDARIWVAGCGTQQAAHWALSFPKGQVVASDLSEGVLAQARGLAEALGVENVRFEQRDLMEPAPEEQFDLVVSTGVVHHLPEPATGLAHLRRALRPGGALQLMVYSALHRGPVDGVRRAAALLAEGGDSDEARYAMAGKLVDGMLDSPRCEPLGAAALELIRARRDQDRSFVADALLHPLEHAYDLDGLMALLSAAGLSFRSWLQPSLWQLEDYLDDPELLARFAALDTLAQWKVIYHVAGYNSPLLELLAEPEEAPEPEPYNPEESFALPMQLCTGARVIGVRQGKPVGIADVPSYVVEGDTLVGRPAAGYGSPRVWRVPAHAEPILESCDGVTPLSGIVAAHREQFGDQGVIGLIQTMLPHDIGLITPVVGAGD